MTAVVKGAPHGLGRSKGVREPLESGASESPPLDEIGAAERWDRDATKRALDELVLRAKCFGTSKEYGELLGFIARFRWYSPFNAMLVYVQKRGARFVLTASRWASRYGRQIKPGAQPLVILQPMGPVMFVFDVSDTEGPPLPRLIEDPFKVPAGRAGSRLKTLVLNTARDGIRVTVVRHGSQGAGSIQTRTTKTAGLEVAHVPFRETRIPVRYDVILDQNHTPEAQFATLVHELGHLYCGHIGTPDPHWWPDRRGLPDSVAELEAESVAYLVCQRQGIAVSSESYLHGYVADHQEIPPISLDRVVKTAGLIEEMSTAPVGPRRSGP